jgi:hypothetical protein
LLKFDWKSLLLAGLAAAFGLWVLQPGAADSIDNRVADLAGRMQALTPRPVADGSILRSVRADGRTLVLDFEQGRAENVSLNDPARGQAQAADICTQSDARALIAAGGRFRIESRTATGEALPAVVVDRC